MGVYTPLFFLIILPLFLGAAHSGKIPWGLTPFFSGKGNLFCPLGAPFFLI